MRFYAEETQNATKRLRMILFLFQMQMNNLSRLIKNNGEFNVSVMYCNLQ